MNATKPEPTFADLAAHFASAPLAPVPARKNAKLVNLEWVLAGQERATAFALNKFADVLPVTNAKAAPKDTGRAAREARRRERQLAATTYIKGAKKG